MIVGRFPALSTGFTPNQCQLTHLHHLRNLRTIPPGPKLKHKGHQEHKGVACFLNSSRTRRILCELSVSAVNHQTRFRRFVNFVSFVFD
jgi:hypothetical protein